MKWSEEEPTSSKDKAVEVDTPEKEIQIVKVIEQKSKGKPEETKTGPESQKPMWAISKSGRNRTRHLVTQASWGLALDEWSTACGWHFAKYQVKVELTRTRVTGPKECQKCLAWMKTRDKVRGGWSLAHAVELDEK